MWREFRRFAAAEQGATAIEYTMLAAVISVPVLLVFIYLTKEALALLSYVAERLNEAVEFVSLSLSL